MNKLDHQLAILEAHRNGRRIQVRDTPPHNEPVPNDWRDLAKQDMWFNFIKFEYRIAPVDKECWLIYDTEADTYSDLVRDSAAEVSKDAIFYNERWRAGTKPTPDESAVRFIPVCMTPKHV